MIAVCDFCCGAPGDRDKPYQMGRDDLVALRLVPAELHALTLLRLHVLAAQSGCPVGPGSGDVEADPTPTPTPKPEPEPNVEPST